MNKAFLLLCSIFLYTTVLSAQDFRWHTSFEDALSEAKESGRPLLMDFHASWCKPCETLETQLWKSPEAAEYASKFVFLRVDFNKMTQVVKKYRVTTLPAVVFTDSWGNYLTRVAGVREPSPYLQLMKIIPTNLKPLEPLQAALSTNPRDVNALRSIARFYHDAQAFDLSTSYYETALTHTKSVQEKNEIQLAIAWNHLKMRRYGQANELFQQFLDQEETQSQDVALFGIVVSSLGLNRRGDAAKALEELQTKFPNSPATAQAQRLMK